ncbi:unnamed protein product, partial [Amoebophrya sp. A120]
LHCAQKIYDHTKQNAREAHDGPKRLPPSFLEAPSPAAGKAGQLLAVVVPVARGEFRETCGAALCGGSLALAAKRTGRPLFPRRLARAPVVAPPAWCKYRPARDGNGRAGLPGNGRRVSLGNNGARVRGRRVLILTRGQPLQPLPPG